MDRIRVLRYRVLLRRQKRSPVTDRTGSDTAGSRSILICFPEKYSEFRIARYTMFPVVMQSGNGEEFNLFIHSRYEKYLPDALKTKTVWYNEHSFTQWSLPADDIKKKIDTISPPDVVVDLNISPNRNLQFLVGLTQAPLRIGFRNRFSGYFYNVEFNQRETSFIEDGYRGILKLLHLRPPE